MIDYDDLFQRAQQARHFFDPNGAQIDGSDHPDYHTIRAHPTTLNTLDRAMNAVCYQRGVKITPVPSMGGLGGCYDPYARSITISRCDRPLYVTTLLHEFCHSIDPALPPITVFDRWFGTPLIPRNEAATIAAQALLADRYGVDCVRHCAVMLSLRLWELEDLGADPDLPTIRSRATDIYEAGRASLDPLLTERVAA